MYFYREELSFLKKYIHFIMIVITSIIVDFTSCVYAEENITQQIRSRTPEFSQQQGEGGWYFCSHNNGQITELVWNQESYGWKAANSNTPRILLDEMVPASNKDIDIKFVAGEGGIYKFSWDIAWNDDASILSDGMKMSVLKGNNVIWSKSIKIGNVMDCLGEVTLEEGDELHFRANCNRQTFYDSFTGFPNVEMIGAFYQKTDGISTLIPLPGDDGDYYASDNIAKISFDDVQTNSNYSMIRRYSVFSEGRYRIYGLVSPNNSENCVIKIYKNNVLVRNQVCLSEQETIIDFRMLCTRGDIIDIEVSSENDAYATWNMDISSIDGIIKDCENTTTAGYSYTELSNRKLSEYISKAGEYGTKFYTLVNGIKYPMEYDTSKNKWEETNEQIGAITIIPKETRQTPEEYANTVLDDKGYIDSTTVSTTKNWAPGSETLIEIPIAQDGSMLIEGVFSLLNSDDGELIKVYINDELLWSNRNGGESSAHFSELYDTKYFINSIHALASVKMGDTLKFSFNKWRNCNDNEKIDISNISLKYITGDIISETTKWKLDESIIINNKEGSVVLNGEKIENACYVEGEETFISADVAERAFKHIETNGSSDAISLNVIEASNRDTVVWINDETAVVHGGQAGLYTWNDISEIAVMTEVMSNVENPDIRYDFFEDDEGLTAKDYLLSASHSIEDGKYVMSVNQAPDSTKVDQIGFVINPVDFGDGGYYMHVKESWDFNSPVNVSAIHMIVAETQNDKWGTTVKLDAPYKSSDSAIRTYDLTEFTGEKEIRRIYNISENSASNVEGSISIDWIVFSKNPVLTEDTGLIDFIKVNNDEFNVPQDGSALEIVLDKESYNTLPVGIVDGAPSCLEVVKKIDVENISYASTVTDLGTYKNIDITTTGKINNEIIARHYRIKVTSLEEEIRYDFIDSDGGLVSKDYLISATHGIENGQYVMSANMAPNSGVDQIAFQINSVDLGTGGYYMHVKEGWSFNSPTRVSAIYSIVSGATVKLESPHKVSDNVIRTYDITEFRGEQSIKRVYNISEGTATNIEGSIAVDWIVFSKNKELPEHFDIKSTINNNDNVWTACVESELEHTTAQKNAVVILAGYDKDNALVKTDFKDITITGTNDASNITYFKDDTIEISDDTIAKAKVFIWDNIVSLKPLTQAEEFTGNEAGVDGE